MTQLTDGAYVARCPNCGAARAAAWAGLDDALRDAGYWRREGYVVGYESGSVEIGPHRDGCPLVPRAQRELDLGVV